MSSFGRHRKLYIGLFTAAFLLMSVFPAQATLIQYVVSPTYDVNKYWSSVPAWETDSTDSLMCWAATASNVLMHTNWGFDRDSDSTIELYDDIYHDFLADFANEPGYGSKAYSHYVPDFWGATLTANGETWQDYFHQSYNRSTMLQSIDSLLHNDYGIYISIGGHAITAWGFEYDDTIDPAVDPGSYYTRLAVSNSDDFFSGIKWYNLDYDGTNWELTNYGAGRNITGIKAYAQNPYAVVPEPATLLLVGTGLVGLLGLRRRFRS